METNLRQRNLIDHLVGPDYNEMHLVALIEVLGALDKVAIPRFYSNKGTRCDIESRISPSEHGNFATIATPGSPGPFRLPILGIEFPPYPQASRPRSRTLRAG